MNRADIDRAWARRILLDVEEVWRQDRAILTATHRPVRPPPGHEQHQKGINTP